MFRAPRVHHQEGQIVSIQFVSPDDEHEVLETCRVINKNKYIERNLCVRLVIYQESLHDARSTKCKNVNTDELFISKGHLKIQREIAYEDTCTNRPSHDKGHLSLSHTDRHRYITQLSATQSVTNSQDIHLLRQLKRYLSEQHFGTKDTVA